MAQLNVIYMEGLKLAKLLTAASAEGDVYVQQLPGGRFGVGPDPITPSRIVDFQQEQLLPLSGSSDVGAALARPAGGSVIRPTRTSGAYYFKLRGKTHECGSLKQLLAEALVAIEEYRPGTLDKLARVKKRTKRIVARDVASLFDVTSLRDKYSERLVDGWWYGTNNSADETKAWLQQACEIAGVAWGEHFSISF